MKILPWDIRDKLQELLQRETYNIIGGNASSSPLPHYQSHFIMSHRRVTNIEHLDDHFNGHRPLWYSYLSSDHKESEIANKIQISDSDYRVANDQTPKKIAGGTISFPDITVAHPD